MPKTTEVTPATGQVWRDTEADGVEVAILHVGSDHALLQRPKHVGRFPLDQFGKGKRFEFVGAA